MMDFTFDVRWEEPGKEGLHPLFKPITLGFASADIARTMVGKIVGHERVPAHSVMLTSADGTVSERWYQLDGKWRRKDA
ncbi:hypothetical protein AYO42_05350 [Rhizomicrobium sp. SCGC AG-212-E05]|nr:hypothetical protein AYO42_05350 [Rhizomicrobium sp. SCGC AG-212-E05]